MMSKMTGSVAAVCLATTVMMLAEQPKPKVSQATAPTANSRSAGEGERVFRQNCARCHEAPTGFSERISGTVLRHMRIRASLSQREQEELMRFFNP